jgi:hypothetical protein
MPFDALVLKVMIASPGDVRDERRIVRDVLLEWNHTHADSRRLVLLPVGWDTHSTPEMGDRPQEIINEQILRDCDLLIAVFWTRIGSPTGVAASGTAEEIQEHLKAGKSAMIYFSSAAVPPDSVDEKQYKALKQFKDECFSKGLVESYSSTEEFRDKLRRQLAQTINRSYPAGTQPASAIPSPSSAIPRFSDEAKRLLVAAAGDRNGRLMRFSDTDGLIVQASGQNFVTKGDPRSDSRWEAVIRELEALDFIEDHSGHERQMFAVTYEGFRVADLLRDS